MYSELIHTIQVTTYLFLTYQYNVGTISLKRSFTHAIWLLYVVQKANSGKAYLNVLHIYINCYI